MLCQSRKGYYSQHVQLATFSLKTRFGMRLGYTMNFAVDFPPAKVYSYCIEYRLVNSHTVY